MTDILDTIVQLSHEFGTPEYVLGGGGNTSCKDADTLWVKPSGTVLNAMTPETFVALSRKTLAELYAITPPEDSSAREALVKDKAMAAVLPDSSGRPSVEAPLHDSFEATYVVHVHPAIVNGLTCAQGGTEGCPKLFPEALWIPYTDPGFTLCMRVREDMQRYAANKGTQPRIVFLENHGIFVAGDTAEAVRETMATVMDALRDVYTRANVSMSLDIGPAPTAERVAAVTGTLQATCGVDGQVVEASGPFPVAPGPLSPDHIVYSKAFILEAEPTPEALQAYRDERGYWPRVVACEDGVFGLGDSEKVARLALLFAQDGALVQQLTAGFGGVQFMDQRASDFIENWEVESYRRKVASQ